MTPGEFTVTIDAKPEVVWPWVADLSSTLDWSPKPYRIEWLEGEPNAVGSRFHSAGVIPATSTTRTRARSPRTSRPTRFAFRSSDPQGEYAHTYTLDAERRRDRRDPPGRVRQDARDRGGAAPPVFALSGKPQGRKRMEVLKQKVEGSASRLCASARRSSRSSDEADAEVEATT